MLTRPVYIQGQQTLIAACIALASPLLFSANAAAEAAAKNTSIRFHCQAANSTQCVNSALKSQYCTPASDTEKVLDISGLAKLEGKTAEQWQSFTLSSIHSCMQDPKRVASYSEKDTEFAKAIATLVTKADADEQKPKDTKVEPGTCQTEEEKASFVCQGPNVLAKTWVNDFTLGNVWQSDYDEDGNSDGLSESGLLGRISFNGRWVVGKETLNGNKDEFERQHGIIQTELGFILGQSAVNQTSGAMGTEMQEEDPSFTDVTDSLDAFAKLTYSPSTSWVKSDNYDSILSFGLMAGVKSRDEVGESNDTVIAYYGPLLEYNLYPKNIVSQGNQIPRGRLSIAALNYEVWGGVENVWRTVISADYLVSTDSSFILGLRANVGRGADDFGVYVGVRKSTKELLEFFGQKVE